VIGPDDRSILLTEQRNAAIIDAREARAQVERLENDRLGLNALLTDCRTQLALALKCVEIGAYPGPGWREATKNTITLINGTV